FALYYDLRAAQQVDYLIAISQTVAKRIKRYYDREAEVIYPPVRVSQFELSKNTGEYFLIISRLVPYKKVDLAIEAFNQLAIPLVIVGEGRDRQRLEQISKRNIHFAERVSDEQLKEYYRKCTALIFPGEEDFGIVPIEANASGKPVIAYAAGGTLETVVDGITGTFFYKRTPQALIEAIRNFNASGYDPTRIREHAMKFDIEVFKRRIKKFVVEKWEKHKTKMKF
ncbi:unnamed protein product, partial [marine sediment metagenome]